MEKENGIKYQSIPLKITNELKNNFKNRCIFGIFDSIFFSRNKRFINKDLETSKNAQSIFFPVGRMQTTITLYGYMKIAFNSFKQTNAL